MPELDEHRPTASPPDEHHLRAQLVELLSRQPLLRATLPRRFRVCGKPGCRCTRGQKHKGLYLVIQQDGKYRQLYVPKDGQDKVTHWVHNAHQVQELLDELSRTYWEKVRQRQD
jgi:hypothetical protein